MAFEYRKGERILVLLPLDSDSADIKVGDAITAAGATDGYFKEVDASGEAIVGIAAQEKEAGDADGDISILVDVSPQSVYEVPPDAGSVVVTLVGKTMDCGADARSADIDASAQDDVYCVGIDTTANTLLCMLRTNPAGVA